MNVNDLKEILESTLDLSFTRFITTKLIKLIYVVSLVMIIISGILILAEGIRGGVATGLASVIVAPLVMVLETMVCRVMLELVMVLFRIAQDLHKIAESE